MTEAPRTEAATNARGARPRNGSRLQPALPAGADHAEAAGPEPPAAVPLFRFVALQVFAAVLLVVLAEIAAERWLQLDPVGTVGLVLVACGVLIGAFHLLTGRRLWALVRANRRLAEGDLAAAVLPLARVRDEIDLIVAWRNHMLRRLIALSEENARLYAETDASLRQRLRELETLYAITRALVTVPDLDATLSLILERLVEVAEARRGAVLLLAPDVGRFEVRAAFRLPPDDWAALAAQLSQTMIQRAEATGAVAVACDPLVLDEDAALPTRLCFPLQTARRTIGGVYLERAAGGRFDEQRVRLLAALADDAALAIERAQLVEAAARAEAYRQADALKSEFLGNVSHDLKTPLTFIRGMAELLATRPFAEGERRAMLQEMITQAEKMTAMIHDLLDLSRIEGGRLELLLEPIDLGELFDQVTALFAGHLANHQLVVEAATKLPAVVADRGRLQQILENLVANATRYSAAGTTVTLRAAAEGGKVVIEVEDQGIGIPADELPRIFERFYRVRSRDTAGIPGPGLGLAIVDQLVRAHGGTVDVRSQVGRGSVFRVTLPVSPSGQPREGGGRRDGDG